MTTENTNKRHRAGFVNIIGNPNVGKSTLMNALVGEKLSIVTAKAQTTRHRIMGIVNGDDYQIVYSDTPGILKPNYRLQQSMMNFVETAIGDADIILYVTDTVEKGDKNEEYIAKLQKIQCPVVLVINKIDISSQEQVMELMKWWKEQLPNAIIFPASAQEKFNLDNIFDAIVGNLPVAPAWYDKDVFTDKNLRFFASEIVREKIFLNYKDEVPYSCEVVVEEGTRKSFCGNSRLIFEREAIDTIENFRTPEHIAQIDVDKLQFPLTLRRWREGDWFVPYGMTGRKKISDYLIDRKVSGPEKERQFVLLSGEDVVWVVGRRIDDRYRLTDQTETVLRIIRETI